MQEPDPFARYAGRVPAPQPAPPVDARPSTLKIEGVTVASSRLTALDQIARKAAAVRAGHADALATLRAQRDDTRQRAALLRGRIAQDPRLSSGGAPHLIELDAEIATLTSRMAAADAELFEAASAAAVARANVKTALAFARDHGLAVPAGLSEEHV